MKVLHLFICASIGLPLHLAAQAAPTSYVCPQSIPATALHLNPPDQGWKPYISSPLYLSGAAPADGPPERLGVLRESTMTKSKSGWTQKYTLQGGFPEGKWLRCDYGSFGEMSLAKRLPDATRECSVTGTTGEHAGENKVEVKCL